MDINALAVFNSLYKLGITEAELKEIEAEQQHIERTGLAIFCVKKDKVVGVSHDDKHQIVINKVQGDIIPKGKSRLLFKTLINFDELPTEIYTLHQIAGYRASDSSTIKYVANNLEELKDRICDRFVDEYPKELGGMYEEVYGSCDVREKNKKLKKDAVEKQLRALFWLFGEDFDSFTPPLARLNVGRIIKVFQRNNRRLAIIQMNEKWNKISGGLFRWHELINRTSFKIMTFKPSDERFNFVSPNREIFLMRECGYRGRANIWLADDMFEKTSAEELRVLSERFETTTGQNENSWLLLTADSFNKQRTAIRLELMNARRREQENIAKTALIKSINKQFKSGKVVRQGIELTKTSISYEGNIIKNNEIGEYILKQRIHLLERPNFNDIIEGLVDYVLQYGQIGGWRYGEQAVMKAGFTGKKELTINKIKLTLEKRNNNFYVNEVKLRQEDLGKVLKNALTYSEQAKYDEWLKYTGKVCLKLQEILKDKAVSFEQTLDTTPDNCLVKRSDDGSHKRMYLSIPIKRKDNKNYATILGKDFQIQDVNALIDLTKEISSNRFNYSGGGYLQRTIRLIYKAINGISAKEIGDLIAQGRKEYRIMAARKKKEAEARIKRSQEFIANAVKLTKATKVDGGYFVKGITNTIYFVDEDSLEVYIVKDGKKDKHLCIVDNDYSWELRDDEALKNDRVAKRLLMLSKDKKVAREIYENGDGVDTWWKDIQTHKNNAGESVLV